MNIGRGHLVYTIDNVRKKCNFQNDMDTGDIKISFTCSPVTDGHAQDLRVRMKITPKTAIKINKLYLDTDLRFAGREKIFLNGYQSWTGSREFEAGERILRLRRIVRPLLGMYGDYGFYRPRGRVLQSWTYTYIREDNGIRFSGSLSESSGFTIFEYRRRKGLRITKDCKGLCIDNTYEAFDLFIATGEEDEIFDRYFGLMNLPGPRAGACTGWTSWYNYYTKISEDIILDNLATLREKNIPVDIFQIDDGYQNAVGDWLIINHKFPRGMKHIAAEIKKCGYQAGLWLAPFVCEKRSQLYKDHPDWVVAKAGYNPGWSGYFYVLDFYNPGVRAYLAEVFKTVFEEWRYDLVKLDFLYAVALLKRSDKTRGRIMHEAMTFLRELAGDKLILGCGVPLGSAFGLVDYCRIGSDVALAWEDRLLQRMHYRERVSTINSLISTIGRRHLNGRGFHNDPDVFILRSNNNRLSKEQRHTLFLLNNIFGSVLFTSDNINEYTVEELDMYQSIFPPSPKKIERVVIDGVIPGGLLKTYFSIAGRQYLAVSNLRDKGIQVNTEADYFAKDRGFIPKDTLVTLNPYQSLCLIKTGPGEEQTTKWLP
jgi:alpha-galactosidase